MSRTSQQKQKTLDAALRSDFGLFVEKCFGELNPGVEFRPNWHIEAICANLECIRQGVFNRLIVNLPPRYLKSILISVAFPAFVLGHDPQQRILVASYGRELALKHANDFRAIVESSWYRRLFPKMRVARSTEDEVATTSRGYRKAVSVGGALTGIGGNMLIIDDPMKAEDAVSESQRKAVKLWFTNTALSRLDPKDKAAIILTMQRLHVDDLVGYILQDRAGWEVLSLSAIATRPEEIWRGDDRFGNEKTHERAEGEALHPGYESLATLEAIRRRMGEEAFAAQYQQSPILPSGGMIERKWFRYYDEPPKRTARSRILMSIDPASKDGNRNDWTVIMTFQAEGDDYYLLDVARARLQFPWLKEKVRSLDKRYAPQRILVEDGGTGTALEQDLRRELGGRIRLVRSVKDKKTRLYLQTEKFIDGHVYFPRNAPWRSELEAELLAFPESQYDDQADAFSQALAFKMSRYAPYCRSDDDTGRSRAARLSPEILNLMRNIRGRVV
jgi:predicted phage terminase large subunit-like protein